ncbi:cell division topological determinant MinJ [Paenibacillus baekrokdamisoli]|uniref:Cell division topological determinant MinJ n=1 Tax=Paenibacillus baekrokdamisoli TaxID=1712516 RepID=A0A3G9J064_9BACL|nr:PDZ domain-containing protein [Paenibacillus baekrokdamisoli]MBB3073317.1 hypothetical protein [Paenibacillus baekrokdamisoli]BBH23942.1 cell division topological determinant MinJ [Paenibacillus baekrokdamisoli]
MDIVLELLRQAGSAVVGLLLSPFYYIAVLLIMLQYMRQTRLERKLFHVKLHAWPMELGRTILAGLVVGLVISCAGLFLGVTVTGEAVLWMWGTAAVLAIVRVRYLCFAYGVGLLGILQWIIGFTPLAERSDWFGHMMTSLSQLDIPGLLFLVAIMHLAEALLVRWQGARFASPLFLEGKRGKLVGGYALQGYWPVPMFMLAPAAAGSGAHMMLPWSTWFGDSSMWSNGFTMIGFPMMIGFTELTRTMLPQAKARIASQSLLIYGICLGSIAIGAVYWSPLTLLAALCSLLLHEAIILWSNFKETTTSPFFVHDERGLRILAVIPGTPAESMGIKVGEVLQKVNGMRVRSKEELYTALHINSAFCKLEVLNLEGHVKFVHRARYAGEHHQLGVVLAPDDQADYYAASANASLLDIIGRRRTTRQRETPSVPTSL